MKLLTSRGLKKHYIFCCLQKTQSLVFTALSSGNSTDGCYKSLLLVTPNFAADDSKIRSKQALLDYYMGEDPL